MVHNGIHGIYHAQVGGSGLEVVLVVHVVAAGSAGPVVIAHEGIAAAVGEVVLGGPLVSGGDLNGNGPVLHERGSVVVGEVGLGHQSVLGAVDRLISTDIAESIQVHIVLDVFVHVGDVLLHTGVVVDVRLLLGGAVSGNDEAIAVVDGTNLVSKNLSLDNRSHAVD